MKKVLIIAVNFPPKGGAGAMRTVKLAKYLPEFGWEPIIVTPPADPKQVEDTSLLSEISEKTTVYRPEYFDYRNQFPKLFVKLLRPLEKQLFFPDKFIQWNKAAYSFITQQILPQKKIDIVYASLGPHSTMLLAHELKAQHNIPFCLDFRDPFSFYQYVILDRKKKFQKKARQIEKKIFKDADHINNVSKLIKEKYEELYPEIKVRSGLIHNGYDEDDFAFLGEKKPNNVFTIGYNGSFSRIVPIEPLIKAIIGIHRQHGIAMRLSISTPIKKSKLVSRYAYLFQNDLIDYKGFLPHKESLKHLFGTDISALILKDIKATEGIIPAKTFEYLRIANPILLLHRPNSHLAQIIATTKTGVTVDINAPDQIEKALLELYEKWRQNNPAFHPDWNEISRYKSSYLTQQFTETFNTILKKNSRTNS